MRVLIGFLVFFSCATQAQVTSDSEIEIAVIEKERETDNSGNEIIEDSIFFQGNFDEAKAKAKEEEKDVLLHFGADWCMPCKQMKKMTYPNSLVQGKMSEGYVPFEVDVDFFWGMDIAEEYGVIKYPTIMIITADGKVKSKHEGYLGPREMYKLIRKY